MGSGVAVVVAEDTGAEALARKAAALRRRALETVLAAGKGHLGGSLSCTEILVALYHGGVLRFDARRPDWPGRDRFILSKAHGCNTFYCVLEDLGFFPPEHLEHYLADGSLLSGHTDHRIPGVEILGGSLGHGLGVAAGMAWGARLDGAEHLVVTLLGDGESQEGSVWEAAAFASQRRLRNLVALTDRNRLGSEDFTERTAGLDPLADRWRAFGWEVREVDGHSIPALLCALADVRRRMAERPLMIVAHTVKGKGISFLENTPRAHHTLPRGAEVARARRDLA
jgi:transketolase